METTKELDEAQSAALMAGRMPRESGDVAWRRVNALATIAVAAELAALRGQLESGTIYTSNVGQP